MNNKLISKRTISLLFVTVLIFGFIVAHLNQQPEVVIVSENSALLYYNAPAAIRIDDKIFVGVTTSSGDVQIITIADRKVEQAATIHTHPSPDDHAAPALWQYGDNIMIATAHHTSDMFVYSMSKNGSIKLLCQLVGSYSYPRYDKVGDEIRLYSRRQTADRGEFGYFLPLDDCSEFLPIQTPDAGQWIYATPPRDGHYAFSIYDAKAVKHTSTSFGNLSILPDAQFPESIAWSSAQGIFSLTKFADGFTCCNVGQYSIEVYKNRKLVFSTQQYSIPYYPGGATLNKSGTDILMSGRNDIERFDTEQFQKINSCQTDERSAFAQHVEGDDSAYVFVDIGDFYNPKDVTGAVVKVCIYP